MQALRFDAYGPPEVLRIMEAPEPIPAAHQVKVRVRSVGLNPLDWKLRAGHLRRIPLFRPPPRGTGCDFAGDVVGSGGGDVGGFFPGARVFGSLPPFGRQGAAAQFVVVDAARVALLPDAVDYACGAALPVAAGTAVQALADHARLASGQRVLICGAAGGVGHFAVQFAKHVGALVTAVCGPGNVGFVRGLGADTVLDYTRDDALAGGGPFDVVFDVAGAWSWRSCRHLLAPEGIYLNTNPDAGAVALNIADALRARFTGGQRVVGIILKADGTAWRRLAQLAGAGTLRPHLARRLTLAEVAEGQRAMETGHGCGKLVVVLS